MGTRTHAVVGSQLGLELLSVLLTWSRMRPRTGFALVRIMYLALDRRPDQNTCFGPAKMAQAILAPAHSEHRALCMKPKTPPDMRIETSLC